MFTCDIATAGAFTDVTSDSGINYAYHTLPTHSDWQPLMAGGAAAADFDLDGWVDLYVTRFNDTDILYRNLGNGTFTDVTNSAFDQDHMESIHSNGVGWADIDNDGDPDLYVTSLYSTRYHLFLNDGLGHFSEQAIGRGAAIQGTDIHFGEGVSFGDYDLDGFLDIHTTEWRFKSQNGGGEPLSNARLLRNLGPLNPAHFVDVTQTAGVAMDDVSSHERFLDAQSFASRFADLDGDGLPDLTIVSDNRTSRLFWNDGDGTFTDGTRDARVGTDQHGMGNTVGDFDGDGDLDWFITSIMDQNEDPIMQRNGNRLFRNEGGRIFSDATDQAGVRDGMWGWGAAFLDYDNDSHLDLVMTNGQEFPQGFPPQSNDVGFANDPMRLWQNDGTGQFNEVSSSEGVTDVRSGKGLLTFDYDKDGDLDLFVVNNNDQPVLYRNETNTMETASNNKWLEIDTIGTYTNRDGIGARITITPNLSEPLSVILREMDGGNNFLGQSENIAHFGLGDLGEATLDRIEIRWTSGLVQEFLDVTTNQRLTAIEPILLLGDLNKDRLIDSTDIDQIGTAIRNGDHRLVFDLNEDMQVGYNDLGHLISVLLGSGSGDADLNQIVDIEDFAALAEGFGKAADWSRGNFTPHKDQVVDVLDFAILAGSFGNNYIHAGLNPPGSTPEPAAGTVLLVGIGLMLRRKHRGR